MTDTKIEWTERVWNPVRGCSRVSEGCRNCYAERMARRFCGRSALPGGVDDPFAGFANGRGWTGRVELIPDKLDEPLRWRKPRRVFVNSMSDLFHEALPDDAIEAVFRTMTLAHWHTFQVLTKRPARMLRLMQPWPGWQPPSNIWLGVSVEDQRTADERIPLLLRTPAAVRFVSYEPALGPVDFERGEWLRDDAVTHGHLCGLDWVIVGGESGPGSRPCDVAWIRSVVRQCREAGVPAFVKQLGARPFVVEGSQDAKDWVFCSAPADDCGGIHTKHPKGGDPTEWPEDLRVREFPRG